MRHTRHTASLSLEPATWDFGTIKRGEIARGKVMLGNYSDTTFTVSLYSTCDCLEASVKTGELPPHTRIPIDLSYLGDVVKERITKTVFVEVDGGNPRRLRIDVTGKVLPAVKPHLLALPNPLPIEKAQGTSNFLEISNRGQQDLVISEIRCYGCESNATQLSLGGGEKAIIVVGLLPRWQGKRWLEIESNDPVTPFIKIAIIEVP